MDVKISINGADYSLQEAVDGGLISGGNGTGGVSSQKNYVIVDPNGRDSGDLNYTCPGGMIMTGVEYDDDGDAHITGILCSPLQ